ncbi:hypothetical protein KQI58_17445 [Enterococcus raffinosus]|uniref:hypothetical protein n=1 Tax=Enterococcus raffinosus TaxID=71452 RepID=UPI001C0FC24A|nr:hypothetical protein [Enterococcus raffinosus]MBU5362840.1 hypothetical protein [Enterococcus raffinosus]
MEIAALNEQVDHLLLERQEAAQVAEKLEAIHQQQAKELIAATTELAELEEAYSTLLSEHSHSIEEVAQLTEINERLQQEKNKQVTKIKQLEEQIRMDQQTIETMKDAMTEGKVEETQEQRNTEAVSNDANELAQPFQAGKEALNDELLQAQEEITKLESQLDDQIYHQELLDKNAELEKKLMEKNAQITRLLEEVASSSGAIDSEEGEQSGPTTKEHADQLEKLATLNEQIVELTETCQKLQAEKGEVTRRLQTTEEVLQQKNHQLQQLEELLVKKSNDMAGDPEALAQAKQTIDDLMKKNDALKAEVTQSQLEIGEVLFTAKKQANRTLEEAQSEAKHLVDAAELEVESISNRAKKILLEVKESKTTFLELYADLESKVEQLTKGALLKNEKQE